MSIPDLTYVLLALGFCLFFTGLVVANRAILKMADELNARFGRRYYRWWNVIGAGSNSVIREYGTGTETGHLRKGYALIAGGIALMLSPAMIRKFTESR